MGLKVIPTRRMLEWLRELKTVLHKTALGMTNIRILSNGIRNLNVLRAKILSLLSLFFSVCNFSMRVSHGNRQLCYCIFWAPGLEENQAPAENSRKDSDWPGCGRVSSPWSNHCGQGEKAM